MKQARKDRIPAVLAILVFLVVELIDLLGIVPLEQRDKFEQICNGVMFAIAVLGLLSFFLKRQSPLANDKRHPIHVLSNLAVPLTAFYMNVNVFQHNIRLEQLWECIWGIHLFWLLFAAVQILLLSGLGRAILNVVRSILEETKKAAIRLRNAARDTINLADNYVLCAVFVSFICWVGYIGVQIYINGAAFFFDDTVVFGRSVRFWTATLLICLLLRIFPSAIQKSLEGVYSLKGGIVLGAIAVIAIAILVCVLPAFPKAIALLILITLAAFFMLWFIIKKLSQPWRKLESKDQGKSSDTGTPGAETPRRWPPNKELNIKYCDLVVVILSFATPLIIIFFITASQPEGRTILTTQDPLDIDTWLEFIDTAAAVAQILLNLFS